MSRLPTPHTFPPPPLPLSTISLFLPGAKVVLNWSTSFSTFPTSTSSCEAVAGGLQAVLERFEGLLEVLEDWRFVGIAIGGHSSLRGLGVVVVGLLEAGRLGRCACDVVVCVWLFSFSFWCSKELAF